MNSEVGSQSSARHRAREVALQTLFAMDVHGRDDRELLPILKEAGESAGSRSRPRVPLRRRPASIDSGDEQHEVHPDVPPAPLPSRPASSADEVFESVAEHFEMPHAAHAFARDLVTRVVEHCDGLDEIVSSHARNWRVSRMAIVDRNVLRLATFELVHTETPAAIVLDEAVELARRFGSDESPPFVNGVLDAVAREVRGEESP